MADNRTISQRPCVSAVCTSHLGMVECEYPGNLPGQHAADVGLGPPHHGPRPHRGEGGREVPGGGEAGLVLGDDGDEDAEVGQAAPQPGGEDHRGRVTGGALVRAALWWAGIVHEFVALF